MTDTDEPVTVDAEGAAAEPMSPARHALHKRIKKTIQADKAYHEKAFKRMRRDMRVAMHGHDEDWSEKSYKANITGRHVKAKTAALYAKNPKAVARRTLKLDFQVWDESQESLMMAFQTVQQAQMLAQAAAAGPTIDGTTGALLPAPEPALPPGFEQAQAVIADFQAGMARRQESVKIGKTLEVLFAHALAEQQPLDFKRSMKQVVRRACTTGVGYVKLAFQRATGPAPGVEYRLTDVRARLARLQQLAEQQGEADFDDHGESAELEAMVADLEAQPEIVVSEGLVFDFPQATRVIPDELTRSLVGFVGARHLTVEYLYTVDEVREMFDVDLARAKYKSYTSKGKATDEPQGDLFDTTPADGKVDRGLACVWEHFDKASGLVYYLCDGYDGFLREPAAPDVYVDQFWPVFALTFNETESEDELFPPSDVTLILDIQKEYNRSRDGKREHRRAARPRWVYPHGAFEDADLDWLASADAFTATGMKFDPQRKIQEILQPVPVPGVDPNLYDVNEIVTDLGYVVGTNPGQWGGNSRATATGDQIAAGASATADGSSVDDLDGFLTGVTRASGQILMREMSPEIVMRVVGPGAVWPEQTLQQIADEMMLEIEAGSTGKPNQQVEVANLEKLLPLFLQIPGINPQWLGREALRRFDDRLDLTDAFIDNLPAIVAQNRNAQPQPGDPNAQPEAQGHQGADPGPRAPGGPAGRGAPTGAQSRPAAV
ncbi:MAG: hypothetical protein WAP03_19305 [Methylorubrum rhodinum]|uniref:hypothetical protein n=1 Tax=Methylorubrum rhodinum TaxID=29428 RepID=UPI003BB00B8F